MPDNGPLWSLAYEIWFYVLAYAIGRQVLSKGIDLLALLLIVMVALVFTRLRIQYLACWSIGAVFYLKPHQLSNFISLIVSFGISAIAIAGMQLTDGATPIFTDVGTLHAALEMLLAVGTGVACVTLVKFRATRLTTAAVPLAAFSYTLYLTHFPLLSLFRRAGWERIGSVDLMALIFYAGVIIACVVMAWIIYWLFERNTNRVRTFIRSAMRGRAITGPVHRPATSLDCRDTRSAAER
jgi:peptidoglycan/LPS O-acetylase OafA/YrhL